MKFTNIRVGRLLTTAIMIALAGAVEASAQTDLTGAWTFTVSSDAGITYPAVTLEQDGETLTGHYASEGLGEADFSGSVSGSEITFMFSVDVGGQLADVVYTGTIDENGEISGTMDIAGGLLTGTFTAVRSDG